MWGEGGGGGGKGTLIFFFKINFNNEKIYISNTIYIRVSNNILLVLILLVARKK